jgi:hypothetical protein
MTRRLLEFNPPLDGLLPQPGTALAPGDEIDAATELLENLQAGQAEAYLVELIDGAARRTLAPPEAGALARLLGRAARRVLRRRDALRSAAVGRLFGLELEGLSGEDQHFEITRQFVRFARAAAQDAARHGPRRIGPPGSRPVPGSVADHAARHAALSAARRFAPGLAPLIGAGLVDPGGRERAASGATHPPSMPGAGFHSLQGARHA